MKPSLLSLLPRPPHPSRDGLAIRNFHLLAALASEFRVRAFCLRDPERDYGGGELPDGVEVAWVPQRRRGIRRTLSAASSLATGAAYSQRLYRSAALEREVAAAAAAEAPAWIVAQSYHLGDAALRGGPHGWIDFHNLDSEIWSRTAETAGSPGVRGFARIQAPRVAAWEGRLARAAEGVSCVSERDGRALEKRGAREPLLVPNGVDLSRYRYRETPPEGEVVFFVGDLSWPPNAEAVRWLARRVWPILSERRPAARVEILGRGAPPDLSALAAPRFALLGEGGDTRPHWQRAAVAAVPLRAGGGSRLKILEAAAAGVPVVSTPVGAEGLDLSPESEIRIAADPAGFAGALEALLADRDAARRQARAARRRVEASYGWDRIAGAFARELARRAEARR